MKQPVLLSFLCVALFGSLVNAGDAQLHVSRAVDLSATPDQVWAVIGDFNGLDQWHPAVVNSQQQGWTRTLTLGDGAKIIEDMLSYDLRNHRYTYAIIESPLPVTNYASTLSVVATEGGSKVVWSSQFDAANASDHEAIETITGVYNAGLMALQKKFL